MRSIVALSLLALAVNARFLQECTNTPDGLYPLGPCESRFLTCSGGIARVMDCPADLIYREDGEFCDWQHNVVGCGGAGDVYGDDNRQSDEASGDADVAADQPAEASGDVYEYTSTDSTQSPEESYGEGSATIASDSPSTDSYTSTEEPTTTTATTTTESYVGSYSEAGTTEETVLDDRAASPEENSGSAPEPVNVCEGREDGTYSDGSCTTLYHICTSNVARFVNCPTPLFYDSVNQKCTWGTHIESCNYHTSATEEPSSDEQSGSGSGEPEATCDGKADGIYPNGVCSTDFLTCSGGIARVMNCPPSLVFNPSIHVCDWPRDVAECSGLPKPQTVCEEDGYFSFGQCSSSFTACTNGRAIVMFCPAGLKFAEDTQRCKYQADAAECQRSADEPSVTTTGTYYEEVPVTTPEATYELASDDVTATTPEAVPEEITEGYEHEEVPLTTTEAPAFEEPSTDSYEQTSVETVAPETTPEPSTTMTVYEEPTEETSAPTTESTFEPASDEPSSSTTVYEEPTEETPAPVTEETTFEPASNEPSTTTTVYEEPADETYERAAEEVSTTTSGDSEFSDETTVVPTETTSEPAADETTTSVASYEQTSEEVSTESTEEVAADEASGEEQNSCTGLADGFYSTGCSPRALSCKNGKEGSFECPSHLVFNEQTSICDYPQTSLKCQYEEQPAEDAKATPFDCSSDGLFSDSLCSASYHQCSSGHLINFTCADANAVFSAAEATCVDQSTLLQCKSLSSPY